MLGERALDSTGLIGMPIYCGNHTQQDFSRAYDNSSKLPLLVSSLLSQSTSTALQCHTTHTAPTTAQFSFV